jgi:hypothetical protein
VIVELIRQEAAPLPLAQPLVNVGFWLVGCAVSVTVTFEAEASTVEIVTAYVAFCPRWMLACEVCTVTHSSGWVGLELGLAATSAVSEACDCEAEAGLDGELDEDGDVDWVGALLGLELVLVDAEGRGDVDGDGEVDEGLGEGEPVLAVGNG